MILISVVHPIIWSDSVSYFFSNGDEEEHIIKLQYTWFTTDIEPLCTRGVLVHLCV